MKNKWTTGLALLVIFFFPATAVKAQTVKGTNYVNAGVGFGTYGLDGTGGIPLTASFEHGFSDKVSAGVYGAFIQKKYYSDVKVTYAVAGIRGSYHFNELLQVNNKDVDFYGGLSVFYRNGTVKYDSYGGGKSKESEGELWFGVHAAVRYMFSKKVGGYAEVGYGVSPVQLGVSFKL